MRKPARTWPLQIAIASMASSALLFFSIGGCSDEQPIEEAPVQEAPPPADPQGTIAPTPSKPPSNTGACEELGALNGAGLTAKLSLRLSAQSFNVPLANRPVPSRLGVVAMGPPAELRNKLVALGTGANANYETCTHCFAIAIGCVENDCRPGTWFYAKSGSAIFTEVAAQSGDKFEGKFSDVTLEQVTIDPMTTQSTPVPGGACFHVGELTFSATASSTPISSADAGTGVDGGTDGSSTSSGGGSSTSGGGGTSSGGCFAFGDCSGKF